MRSPLHTLGAGYFVLALAASSIGTASALAAAPGADRSAKTADPSKADQGTSAYQNQFSCIPEGRETTAIQSATQSPIDPAPRAPEGVQATTAGKDGVVWRDVVISHYQHSGTSTKANCGQPVSPAQAQPRAPAPDGLKGKTQTIEAGMVTPAVRSGRSYVPPKPKPDTSKDDCMSCDD